MANGVSIVQEGVDMDNAFDSQKVLDTRWKYLEIAREEKVTANMEPDPLLGPPLERFYATKEKVYADDVLGGTPRELFSHDLGFMPAFEVSEESFSRVLVRIYNLDITAEYQAPIVKTAGPSASRQSNTGVRVAGNNTLAVGSNRASDMSLSSATKALAVQRTGTQTVDFGSSGRLTVEHGLGYPPMFLFTQFYKNPGNPAVGESLPAEFGDEPVIHPLGATVGVGTADGKNVSIGGGQGALLGSFAYIILKELAEVAA